MYYLLIALLYPISLLPFPVLYFLSDGIKFLMHRVFKYRVGVVRENLAYAFPQLSIAQRKKIESDFYRSLSDQLVETIKLLSISKKTLLKRFKLELGPFNRYYEKGIACYGLMAHNFNFEWGNVAANWCMSQPFVGIYMPIANKGFERLMLQIRTRSNGSMIPASNFRNALQEMQGSCFVIGLVSDQNPSNREKAQWEVFLNREAPFYRGPAEGAIKQGIAVAFAYIKKLKRGHYLLEVEDFVDDASTVTQPEITRAYVRYIEQKIIAQPENYLWTHKRWKHKRT